jgi:O-antigen ligase
MKKYFFQITGILIIILSSLTFIILLSISNFLISYSVFAILILLGFFVVKKGVKGNEPLKMYWLALLVLIIILILFLTHFIYNSEIKDALIDAFTPLCC